MKDTIELCKEAGYPLMTFDGKPYVSPELERLVALVRADERSAPVTKDEALDLALEALEYIHEGANNQGPHTGISWRCVAVKAEPAITAIKQARALDKKAENARELGLDYEPDEWMTGCPECGIDSGCDCDSGTWNPPAQPAPVQEPLEYWNAVEGWVKIDEVREHFDSVGCGTIYKTAGDGRVPLTAAQRQWVGLTDEEIVAAIYKAEGFNYGLDNGNVSDKAVIEYVRIVEAKLKEKNT
jgi:hypothetical protein